MKQPMQLLYKDKGGEIRFKDNKVVRALLDMGKLNLNDLSRLSFPEGDWEQFLQLIGYSLNGYGEIVNAKAYERAEKEAATLK